MNKLIFTLFFPLAMMACSSSDGDGSSANDSGSTSEKTADEADLKAVDESISIESRATEASEKADSILNEL